MTPPTASQPSINPFLASLSPCSLAAAAARLIPPSLYAPLGSSQVDEVELAHLEARAHMRRARCPSLLLGWRRPGGPASCPTSLRGEAAAVLLLLLLLPVVASCCCCVFPLRVFVVLGVEEDGLALLRDDDEDGMAAAAHLVHARRPRGPHGPAPLHQPVDLGRTPHHPLAQALHEHAAAPTNHTRPQTASEARAPLRQHGHSPLPHSEHCLLPRL